MDKNQKNIILVGGGGHCNSVIDVIEQENKYTILGIIDANIEKGKSILGYPVLGNDDVIASLIGDNNYFIITVGHIMSPKIRVNIAERLDILNANLATVVSSRAYVSKHAIVGAGTVIMHDVIINANANVGDHCIINTKANIEHDAVTGDFCHVSTGAILNGDVKIGNQVFVGSNACLMQGISISDRRIIRAGEFIKDSK